MISVRARMGKVATGLSLLVAVTFATAAMKPETSGTKVEFSQISMLDARVNLTSSYLRALQARGGGIGRATASQHAIAIDQSINAWQRSCRGWTLNIPASPARPLRCATHRAH